MALVPRYPRAINIKIDGVQMAAIAELAEKGQMSLAAAAREYITAGMIAKGVTKK